MKKTYEKPVLTTEEFDVEDVVTASVPGTVGLSGRNGNWDIPFDPSILPLFH